MEDIVEAALENPEEIEGETSDDPLDGDGFGLPICTLVGCGPAGLSRVKQMENADSTAVVADSSAHGTVGNDVRTRIPVTDAPGEWRTLEHPDFESAFEDGLTPADIVVVTGHLEDTTSARLLETVCRQLPEEPTVLAVPSVPAEGLSIGAKTAFFDLVNAVGTTIPYDLRRIDDAFHRTTPEDDALEIANSLIVEWLEDVFEMFREPIVAGPCNRRALAWELLECGGTSLLYWGWGTREDDPEVLVEYAASHRFCDGDRRTATGGFGFVRFGHEFTRGEFESLEAATRRHLRPDGVEGDRWLVCGDSTLSFSDECRLAHLVVDVDPESLAFL